MNGDERLAYWGQIEYVNIMGIKRTSHAVYETKYHLVWIPKYRKEILTDKLAMRVEEIFREIAEEFGFEIDTMEVMVEHVHIFLSFSPRYSISKVVGIMKSISSSRIFREFPWLEDFLWGGEFWSAGYFARTVGDKVTSEVIRRYIEYHREEDKSQLELF